MTTLFRGHYYYVPDTGTGTTPPIYIVGLEKVKESKS